MALTNIKKNVPSQYVDVECKEKSFFIAIVIAGLTLNPLLATVY
jgi:hypothetical protein